MRSKQSIVKGLTSVAASFNTLKQTFVTTTENEEFILETCKEGRIVTIARFVATRTTFLTHQVWEYLYRIGVVEVETPQISVASGAALSLAPACSDR